MFKRIQIKLAMAGLMFLAGIAGCTSNQVPVDEEQSSVSSSETGSTAKESRENQTEESDPPAGNSQAEEGSQTQPQAVSELDEELARYRAERERGVSVSGDYAMVVAPNSDDYFFGIGSYNSSGPSFDTIELNEAYKTADTYIRNTLHLESEAWFCVDPRMTAIYEDEDKGVANGYDSDDIFLCEYNDNGNWKYMILVREGKGSDWNVLFCGNSYKTN